MNGTRTKMKRRTVRKMKKVVVMRTFTPTLGVNLGHS
jgi:hypothetical protein